MSFFSDLGDGLGSVGRSITGSFGQLSDSIGDFGRAVGRGDLGSATQDLLSIGSESLNIMTGGALNLTYDAFRRWAIPDIPEADYADRKVTVSDADAAQRMVYGTVRTGGVTRYIESSGADDQFLHLIVVFAAHSCAEVTKIYFGDDLAFNGEEPKGDYEGKAICVIETGKQTAANPEIVASTPSGWTSDHKLLGKTYAYFRLEYDTAVFGSAPVITALIKGKDDIYDPRTGSYGYTNNQALVTRDYITSEYGYGVDTVNEESFIYGANVCDEWVTAGAGNGNDRRYTADGTISVVDDPSGPLQNLMQAGASSIQYVQGEFLYIPGEYQAPSSPSVNASYEFNENDLIGGISLVPTGDIDSRVNTATGNFIDPNQDYEIADFVPITISEYEAQDKETLAVDTSFQFVRSGTTARRLSKIMLERSRYGVSVSAKFTFKMLSFSVGDRIELSIDLLGWSGKIFRIESMEIGLDGITCDLLEDGEAVWSWSESDALFVTPPPAVNLPNPRLVSAPTNITASESLYFTNDANVIRSRVTISWDGNIAVQRWSISGSYNGGAEVSLSDYLTSPSFRFDDAEIGDWVFYVYATNAIGVTSDAATYEFTALGKTAPPADVSVITATQKSEGVSVSWQPVTDIDVAYYELRLDQDFGEEGSIYRGLQSSFLDERRESGVTYYVKAFDTSGNYSTNSAVFAPDISGPSTPLNLIADSSYNNVFLKWNASSSVYPIDYYVIKKGADFATAEEVGRANGTFQAIIEQENGTFRYWVYAVDMGGNESANNSALASVDAPPDYILRVDDFVDFELLDESSNLALGSNPDTLNTELIGPANTTETFLENMQRSGLTGTDPYGDKEANGYTHWLEPSLATAYARRDIDFGATVPSSRINVTIDTTEIVAGATVDVTLSTSPDAITWTEYALNQTEIGASNFRYLRVELDVSTTGGVGVVIINSVRFKLDVKQKTDQGKAAVLASDVDGTVIYTNKSFLDIDSVVATPKAIDAKIAVTQFDDVGNQDHFNVLVFDRSTGARVDADISWQVRGS